MATHESARKAARQAIKRAAANQAARSRARSAMKKLREALAQPNQAKETVLPLFQTAQSELMRIARKGIIRPKTASRYVSRLSQAVRRAGITA